MNSEILKKKLELENDRVLLVPFENLRNKELEEIIFDEPKNADVIVFSNIYTYLLI